MPTHFDLNFEKSSILKDFLLNKCPKLGLTKNGKEFFLNSKKVIDYRIQIVFLGLLVHHRHLLF